MRIVGFAVVAFVVVMFSAGGAQAQSTDKQVVRCVDDYGPGMGTRNMLCQRSSGTFTKVPSNKYFSVTEVTLVPYNTSSTTITGLSLQRVLDSALFDLFYLRHVGGSSATHSWRSPPLVLGPGTSLQLSSFHDTNTYGQIIVTGILSPDYQASVR